MLISANGRDKRRYIMRRTMRMINKAARETGKGIIRAATSGEAKKVYKELAIIAVRTMITMPK